MEGELIVTMTAEKCYDTYVEDVGGFSIRGEKLPPFGQCPDNIQRAWGAVSNYGNRHAVDACSRLRVDMAAALEPLMPGLDDYVGRIQNPDGKAKAEMAVRQIKAMLPRT